MGLGVAALGTFQKREPSGGGGSVTGANEGLSLDGTIVQLGRLFGDISPEAIIDANREIPMNGGASIFITEPDVTADFLTNINAFTVELNGNTAIADSFFAVRDAATAQTIHYGIFNPGIALLRGPAGDLAMFDTGNWGFNTQVDDATHLIQVLGNQIWEFASNGSKIAVEDFAQIVMSADDWVIGGPAMQLIQNSDGTSFQVIGQSDSGGDAQGVIGYDNQTSGNGSSIQFNSDGGIVMFFRHPSSLDTGADLQIQGSISTDPTISLQQGVWLLGDIDNNAAVPTLRIGVNVGGVDYWIPAQAA